MTDQRIEKIRQTLSYRQNNLTVILEDVLDGHNIGAIIRSCDAVGIGEIYIVHTDKIPYCKVPAKSPVGKKSSAGVSKWVKMHHFKDVASCFSPVRKKYTHLYTTHLAKDALSLYNLDLKQSTALVFGNELTGISEEAIALADGNFVIPMMGMMPSLNISVACAVSVHEAYRQRNGAGMYDPKNFIEFEVGDGSNS